MATLPTSALRNAHEAVLPPVPLSLLTPSHTPPVTSTSPTPATAPHVNGAEQQAFWLATLRRMRAQPGADQAALSAIESHITTGVSLPLLTDPSTVTFSNTPTVTEHADAVRARLHEYMEFGAVVRLPADTDITANGVRVQPLHVIIKTGKKPRLVIDLSRNLNAHLEYEYFHYSSVDDAVEASHPNCWYGKLDLSNCFLSFPLLPEVRKFFCFRFEGELYQFTHMPFGLSTAPRVCTQLLSVVHFALSELGIRAIVYLDDFFFIAASSEEMSRHLTLAQSTIRQFGLIVNPDKTEGPSQTLSFLGVQLDSVNQTVSCTAERVSELNTLLRSLLRQRVITRGHAASLIGKLSFAAQVLPGARPFMRRMLDALHLCKSRRHSTPIRIDPGFRDDVRFWVQQLHHWNGRQQWRSSRAAPFVFASDASLRGFGFYLESAPTLPASTVDSTAWPQPLRVGATFSGTYSPEHAHLHHSHTQIAWCELLAVVACATTYAPHLTGQSLLFHVDNSTDVHIINRQATRSKALAGLLRQLYTIALRYNLHIRACHRPGVDNTLADFLSRPELHRGDHVAQWTTTHPSASACLSSVSLVSSRLYVNSSTASPATRSDSTRTSRTSHDSAPSTPSAPPYGSTPSPPSPSSSCAASASSTPTVTASQASPASCPPSLTTPCAPASPTSLVVAPSTVSKPASSTTTATPTTVNPPVASPSKICTTSVSTSTSTTSLMPVTGALPSSPSSASSASKSTPALASSASTSPSTSGGSTSPSPSPRPRSSPPPSPSYAVTTHSAHWLRTSRTPVTSPLASVAQTWRTSSTPAPWPPLSLTPPSFVMCAAG
jgi:hypothetical protein